MKKLIILALLAVMMAGCTHTIKDKAKVIKIEYANSNVYTYKITVTHCDNHSLYNGHLKILTNIRYNIGDSINIIKK